MGNQNTLKNAWPKAKSISLWFTVAALIFAAGYNWRSINVHINDPAYSHPASVTLSEYSRFQEKLDTDLGRLKHMICVLMQHQGIDSADCPETLTKSP